MRGAMSLEERFIGNANLFTAKERKKLLKCRTKALSPQALLADDYETVLELAPDPATVHEHCDPYEDTDWSLWDYETGFRMVMSDGQVMGVVLYENDDDSWEIDSFVSYQEGDGFDYTGYGDHQVTLYSDGGYSYLKNGNELVSNAEGQGSFTMESEEDVYTVWHM